ncbi:transcriptional regulator family: Fungal Specific TF [Penicillium nucicola]|uniref:transcriptional regulator family: Fungal Specific TF n=1 Tax=Penicillium nucicola TaxID=1850975 RepID=UPI002544FFFA|nr:transcriptional regulator family: Fungal Specific TF [Penicillium nucicola]KAJ5776300.1 transcriptional regulator family: Fungal Specific TF [Penicillium nucicola]
MNAQPKPVGLLELVYKLNQHEMRIRELETKNSSLAVNTDQQNEVNHLEHHQDLSSGQKYQYDSPESSIDGIHLGPPIATLRSLRVLAEEGTQSFTRPAQKHKSIYDPIYQGLISVQDVQRAIEMYRPTALVRIAFSLTRTRFFQHCHASAPVLDENICFLWREYLEQSPALILAICSVGTRFWDIGDRSGKSIGSHLQFHNLTKLLDKAVSRLLLRPTPSDVTLESICVLLLYAQWMPCSREDEEDNKGSQNPSVGQTSQSKSRYNEISAWVVLGLAERYSVLLGLEQSATSLFKDPSKIPSADDINRLRVWYNLLTCNFNLMLTSGLPASIDPGPSVEVARKCVGSELMQSPADSRVRGLVELVGLVYLAMSSCGDRSGRQLQPKCLEQLNSDLDDWESGIDSR